MKLTAPAQQALRHFSRRDFLKASGALVVTFSAAAKLDAQVLAEEVPRYDLVIVDWRMGPPDGIAMLRAMRCTR